jgi:hypothetical protein
MSAKPAVNGTVGAAIIVDPFDPRTIWLGTGGENDEIWRSGDCGATWDQVNTGTGGIGDGMTSGGVGDGAQWSMQIDPVDPGVLYATSGYGAQGLWKTIDGGTTWVDILADTEYATVADYRFVNNVSLDPTDHLHVVVSTHGACQPPYDPSCIAESTDGGDSWRIVTAPEAWVDGGGLIVVSGVLWIWCGTSLMVTTNAGESGLVTLSRVAVRAKPNIRFAPSCPPPMENTISAVAMACCAAVMVQPGNTFPIPTASWSW